jgi:hypothetical protein
MLAEKSGFSKLILPYTLDYLVSRMIKQTYFLTNKIFIKVEVKLINTRNLVY